MSNFEYELWIIDQYYLPHLKNGFKQTGNLIFTVKIKKANTFQLQGFQNTWEIKDGFIVRRNIQPIQSHFIINREYSGKPLLDKFPILQSRLEI